MDVRRNLRIVIKKHGGPEVLEVVEEELPEPGAGEVRLKMAAAGISGYDRMLRSHWLPGFPRTPFTPGVDFVGTVDKLGAGVSTLKLGQMVAAGPMPRGGGYTQYLCERADELVAVPADVDPVEAACLVTDYVTAHHALHGTAKVRDGERALVHGAAGGVGTALLELGRLAGLELYGTASHRNHDLVSSLGATPIDYHSEDFVERIHSLTGTGADVVFDPIGGAKQLRQSYRALGPGGRLVWFGVADTSHAGIKVIPLSLLAQFSLKLLPDGKTAPTTKDVPRREQMRTLTELLDLLSVGKISPVVCDRVQLPEAAAAHAQLERGGHAGKIVLVCPEQ